MHGVFLRTAGNRVADFLSGVDSLQDPVTVGEIEVKFRQILAREGIRAPFKIMVTPVDVKKDVFFSDSTEEQVVLGFAKPMSYRLQLGNTFWLTARRLGPQVLFSLVLVGVTIFSFLLLYRNWRQQQKLATLKNDFISNITHELKTPIATVSVAVEALKDFSALEDPARTREYLEISAHELQRLSLLVDKVLKLTLFERQEIELKKDDFDLKILVEEVMASMRLQFEKNQASIDMIVTGEEKFLVRADKLHFTSVVYNLLDNALKYSRPGPVLRIDLGAEQGHLVLAVTDNGIGIPAAYQDRVFEKFFRVPTGDQHNVKGYGLGLSYVAYVVQRHGGEIKVRSKEGVGSIFKIKIPRGYA
jgi:two-component system phosphate regulon sensor histidine kinase PhoR